MPQAALLAILGLFLTLAITALSPAARIAIGALVSEVAFWIGWTILKLAPTLAAQLALGLVKAFTKDRDLWARVSEAFAGELTEILGAGGQLQQPQAGPLPFAAGDIGARLGGLIIDAIAPAGDLSEDQGRRNLEKILGLAVVLNMQGWWVTMVGEIASLGVFRSAAALPAAVEGGLGLNRLARLAWRTPIKKAIAEPLEELYNRRYHFKKLTISEARELWHRGVLDDAGFLDVASSAGYDQPRAAQILELAKRLYDTAQIRDLWRLKHLPDTFLLDLLREQGYTSGRAETVLALVKAKDEETILKELADQARRLYRTGRLSQQQLEAILDEANFPANERGIILATEDLIRAETKTLTAGEVQAAYRANAIDAPDARRRLRELLYRDEDIDVLLSTHRRELSPAQIVDAVARGRITQDQARTRLQAEGYSLADADLIVSLRGRRLSEGQIMDALREGIINAQQARADLVVLGFSGDQVDILLAFLRKELSPAEVQAAVLRGLLTVEQAEERLIREGYTPADAAIIVTLRRRLLSTGEVLDAFEDGLISRQDALGDLQARGFTPDDALAIVRVFEQRVAERLRRGEARPPAAPRAPARPAPPSGRRRGTGGTPPAAPPAP